LLRSKLPEIAKRIARAVDAITDSDSPPKPILDRLDELDKEKADLEMEAFMSSIHARTAPQSISQKLSKHTLNLKKKRTHSKKAI
ncbi:MAG: hypothetical protein NT027_16745, partial [Proteobacteria bacterium]|nr:hypothetical protein [Pseudomonadota bacterium]